MTSMHRRSAVRLSRKNEAFRVIRVPVIISSESLKSPELNSKLVAKVRSLA